MKVKRLLILVMATCLASGVKSQVYYEAGKAFDLKGKVKTCEVRQVDAIDALKFLAGDISSIAGNTTESYSFSSNGKLIPDEGEEVTYEGKYLKKIISGDNVTEFMYENGRLRNKNCMFTFFGMPSASMYIYTYNNKGMIIKKVVNGDLTTTYSDYKLDSKGNWVKRIGKIGDGLPFGEARIIKYY